MFGCFFLSLSVCAILLFIYCKNHHKNLAGHVILNNCTLVVKTTIIARLKKFIAVFF